jgi:hypothetical protein
VENKELGRLVLKQAEAEPRSLDMCSWGHRDSCGTVACIAGWAMIFSGYTLPDEHDECGCYQRPDGTHVSNHGEEGQRLLGLSNEERYSVFTVWDDGYDLFFPYEKPRLALQRLRELCEDE